MAQTSTRRSARDLKEYRGWELEERWVMVPAAAVIHPLREEELPWTTTIMILYRQSVIQLEGLEKPIVKITYLQERSEEYPSLQRIYLSMVDPRAMLRRICLARNRKPFSQGSLSREIMQQNSHRNQFRWSREAAQNITLRHLVHRVQPP